MHKGFVACAVVSAVVMATATGCGSSGSGSNPFGAEPNYDEVQGHFNHPDGTFNGSNAGTVIGNANGSSDANAAGVFNGGSSSSGTVTTKALHILGGDAQLQCSDLQAGNHSGSCACPSGGGFTYELDGGGDQSNADVTMKLKMNACASQDVVVDGTEFLHMTSAKDASGQSSLRMLFVIKATVTKAGVSHTFDLAEEYDNATLRIAVKVDDGWVSITFKSTANGATYEVRDKDGTWTCTYANGAGSCTSDKGGQPVTFKQ